METRCAARWRERCQNGSRRARLKAQSSTTQRDQIAFQQRVNQWPHLMHHRPEIDDRQDGTDGRRTTTGTRSRGEPAVHGTSQWTSQYGARRTRPVRM